MYARKRTWTPLFYISLPNIQRNCVWDVCASAFEPPSLTYLCPIFILDICKLMRCMCESAFGCPSSIYLCPIFKEYIYTHMRCMRESALGPPFSIYLCPIFKEYVYEMYVRAHSGPPHLDISAQFIIYNCKHMKMRENALCFPSSIYLRPTFKEYIYTHTNCMRENAFEHPHLYISVQNS